MWAGLRFWIVWHQAVRSKITDRLTDNKITSDSICIRKKLAHFECSMVRGSLFEIMYSYLKKKEKQIILYYYEQKRYEHPSHNFHYTDANDMLYKNVHHIIIYAHVFYANWRSNIPKKAICTLFFLKEYHQ